MALFDRVCAEGAQRAPVSGQIAPPCCAGLALDMSHASRIFVLDDTVAALVAHFSQTDPSAILERKALARAPGALTWVEWSEAGHQRTRARLELACPNGGPFGGVRARRGRVGLLVNTSNRGRSGEIRLASIDAHLRLDIAPFILDFDLDNPVLGQTQAPGWICEDVALEPAAPLNVFAPYLRLRRAPQSRVPQSEAARGLLGRGDLGCATFASVADFALLLGFWLALSTGDKIHLARTRMTRKPKPGAPKRLPHIEATAILPRAEAGLEARCEYARAHARRAFILSDLAGAGEAGPKPALSRLALLPRTPQATPSQTRLRRPDEDHRQSAPQRQLGSTPGLEPHE